MSRNRRESVNSLLLSGGQLHLTLYASGDGGPGRLKLQLLNAMAEARLVLGEVLSASQLEAFFAPIVSFMEDHQLTSSLKGNLGFFRTQSSFRVLRLPIEVGYSCHVASSFHVKPILKWLQWDFDFYLAGFTAEGVHLYQGNQNAYRKIDSFLIPLKQSDFLRRSLSLQQAEFKVHEHELRKSLSSACDWVSSCLSQAGGRLFLAGDGRMMSLFLRDFPSPLDESSVLKEAFSEDRVLELIKHIRSKLHADAFDDLEREIRGFGKALKMKRATSNIRQVALAAVQGRIRKLLVAENYEAFGRIDPKSGSVVLHPFDLDHQDDDLLDDLAQTVLAKGGEVFLAPRDQIPNHSPILAIVEPEPVTPQSLTMKQHAFKRSV